MSSAPHSPSNYEPLRTKEETDSIDGLDILHLQRHHQRPRRRKLIKAAKIISGLGLVAFIVLTFALSFHAVDLLGKIGAMVKQVRPSASHQRSYKYPCGLSAAEANEKGCIFDVMSMAWQSPECFDEDLHEEFMEQGPWEFYADPEATQIMTYDQVSERGQITWTTRKYFVIHCVYGWKAMHRAWQRGWRMDSNLASIAHTELCSRVLSNTSIPMEAMTTRIHVDFPSCN